MSVYSALWRRKKYQKFKIIFISIIVIVGQPGIYDLFLIKKRKKDIGKKRMKEERKE